MRSIFPAGVICACLELPQFWETLKINGNLLQRECDMSNAKWLNFLIPLARG
jgi:hypothetical protein